LEPSAGRASPEERTTASAGPPAREATGQAEAVEWTIRPWREHRAGAALTALGALLLGLLAAWVLPGQLLPAALLALAVLGSLAPGMAPIRCRVDGGGVARSVLFTWERRSWAEIRRARLGAAGLFVSPCAESSRLERFRGLFLPLPRQPAGAAALRERLQREVVRHGL
jgi:hypothetical protein